MINAATVGNNIKMHREKLNLTQLELAQKLFVSFQAVSAWERGQSLPDLENAVKLSNIFGIKTDTLLKDQDRHLYAAVDGGGSKTEFILFEKNGTVLKRAILTGSNPNDIGIEKSADLLCRGLDLISGDTHIESIFAGIAGCTTGNHKNNLRDAISSKTGSSVYVDTDAINVLAMGKNMSNSASVICGTGSCVFIRKNFELLRLGGWGYLFDRAGSAFDIGSDAIIHALSVNDGLVSPTLLSEAIEKALGGNVWRQLSGIYEKGRSYIASLAPIVLKCFNEGDKVSELILINNAQRLSDLIKLAVKKHSAPKEFVCAGGFFKNPYFKELVEEMSEITLYAPLNPPVYGAALECMRLNGISVTHDFEKNFINSAQQAFPVKVIE